MTAKACIHHWVLTDVTKPLVGLQAAQHLGCVGRQAKCKKCKLSKLLPERTDFMVEV